MRYLYKLIFLLTLATGNYSCKKFLEIGPPMDSASPEEMFQNDAVATSSITGIYSRMASLGIFSGNQNSIGVICGLSSDELKSHSVALNNFYNNQIPTNKFEVSDAWSKVYAYIYTSNTILDALNRTNGVTESTKKQLLGEAKFIRAFCYFHLVNLFGEVPLNLVTDYRVNGTRSKSSKEKVYNQIIEDLTDAENLLSTSYVTTERVRPNKWVAKSLLARVYLYNEKWELAAQKASEIIDQKPLYELVDDLDKVFLKNSTEAIWQLMPTEGTNTKEGALFVLNSTPTFVSLSPNLIPLFEINDNRKNKWTNTYTNATGTFYYPNKYKVKTTVNGVISEYSMVIRLAELYLIRAEARSHLSQLELALEDINRIRKRAGMPTPIIGFNQVQCLDEIEKQRKLELFSEWGHRWFDLVRTGKASSVLMPLKGAFWQVTDILFPIPENELSRNPNMRQNPGY